ncbi:hypothetical protein NUU61_002811, partial [Penicillium alfredii]
MTGLDQRSRGRVQQVLRTPGDSMLRFTKKGTFQISVFEDLHFGEDASADTKSSRVMNKVLSKEDAQLVVLNGDLISGEATNSTVSDQYFDDVVAPLVDRDLSWATTYGNHDSETNLDPWAIYKRDRNYPNSHTRSMVSAPDAGITNYYLPVLASNGTSKSTPELILWFFDSKGGSYARDSEHDSGARPNWIDESVVDWFTATNANLTAHYGKTIPSLAFFHIPANAMLAHQESRLGSRPVRGINGERVNQQGYKGGFPYDGQDRRFMEALLNTTGLMATFSGHDHDNDWCFKWDDQLPGVPFPGNGIHMCYGRHSGYGGYGNAARGARQILLQQGQVTKGLQTWVRLEDDSISSPSNLSTHSLHRIDTPGYSAASSPMGAASPLVSM